MLRKGWVKGSAWIIDNFNKYMVCMGSNITSWNRQPKRGKEGYSAYVRWKVEFCNNESRIDNTVDQQVRKGGGWGENGH